MLEGELLKPIELLKLTTRAWSPAPKWFGVLSWNVKRLNAVMMQKKLCLAKHFGLPVTDSCREHVSVG
jgi:hypothetical protein